MPRAAILHALKDQRAHCARMGSPLYAALLDITLDDVAAGGPCAGLLEGVTERPAEDAVPLRWLGALHRLVLNGEAPALARHFPSVGGRPGASLDADLLATVRQHLLRLPAELQVGVQTNEVGRAAAIVGGVARVAQRSGLPLRLLEIGASAGLLLRLDRYAYVGAGDPESPVRFDTVVPPFRVQSRRGNDVAPVALDGLGRLRLLGFVWADQLERVDRLRAALQIAEQHPVHIDAGDAGAWLEDQLNTPRAGVATVVYHSIVWQYLPASTREHLRTTLETAGARATPEAPLGWLRFEPDGDHAALQLRTWPGEELLLAHSGFHGAGIRWFV